MTGPFDPERRPVHDEWAASDQAPGYRPPAGYHAPEGTQAPGGQAPAGYPAPGALHGTPYYQAPAGIGHQAALPGPGRPESGYYGDPYPNTISAPYTVTTAEPTVRSKRGRRVVIAALAALAIAAAGGAAGAAAVGLSDHGNTASTANTSAATPVQTVVNSSNTSVANLVKAVDPEVVSLTVTSGNSEDEGSGIVLKSNGVILTNNHVISAAENGGTIQVAFTDGTSAPATIVAADASEDLAIVKAGGVSGLATATLADSGSVKVGDTVVAIGNELGLSNSVSAGIVSALHRKVSVAAEDNTPLPGFGQDSGQDGSSGTTYPNAIQTDASINEGDSGGALFNMQGQVIGIDSAIATGSGGSSGSVGVGFAIAINDAKAFIAANS
ncbi:MAG TPA: trypsin-like peptidase domain-containing protein [Micromonosporaceae bacterium]